MEMYVDGVQVFVILGHCEADEEKRNIDDLLECPCGHGDICDPDCCYYCER